MEKEKSMAKRVRGKTPKLPKKLGANVEILSPTASTEPVGRLKDHIGESFALSGPDGSGKVVEWIIKPTGGNSFEITVPASHELGTPDSWENISIMTQRVVCKSGSCGCDGNQCGCQGQNCGSNCNSNHGRIRLLSEEVARFNETTLNILREKFR
jgi:hypothetical protein